MLNISVSGFYEWRHCDKVHRFGIVETDDFIVQTLKAIIKNSCGGHIPGVLVCYLIKSTGKCTGVAFNGTACK